MTISTSSKKVRATELLVATRGAKAALVVLRRWYNKFRGSSSRRLTGKTGGEIMTIDRTADRENEINEARLVVEEEVEQRKRTLLAVDDEELRNIDNENHENELRELLMSGKAITDTA